MKQRLTKVLILSSIVFLALSAAACSRTTQARSAEKSGFLKDYSKLEEGEKGEALLVYVNPMVDFNRYTTVLIEPVRIYAPEGSDLAELSGEDRQALVDYFSAAIRTELKKDFYLTEAPGPNVMRIRVALTNADSSSVVMDTISNIAPPALALNALKTVAFGQGLAVGDAQMEAEISDSVTNKRLGAAVDKRVGGKTFEGKFSKWDDAKGAFDYWAKRLRTRLKQERSS